ncbi:MAG: PAS domain-containing protein, partial [Acholeplasmataceae bacterium]
QGKERIFDRPITIIGRHVSMCHPPASVHIVEEIVESFRSGRKHNEDFWIRMKDMFVYIRYFAVRNKSGEYLGTLEVTQNIKPITELEGEKRLVSKD